MGNELIREEELQTQALDFQERARQIEITDDITLNYANDFLKGIKTTTKNIVEFFEPIKSNAHKAWKSICDKENEYKKPLDLAEKTIKNKIVAYNVQLQEQRRKEEEALRKQQQEEAERLAKEAQALEQQGQAQEAEKMINRAITVEKLSANVYVPPIKAEAEGLSFQTDYIIDIEDEQSVPAYANGIQIRSIDVQAIKKLAKMTNGKIDIPGIKITETKIAKVRI